MLLDPSAIAVAVDVNPVVKILDQAYAATDSVGIRVVTRLDFKPVAPHSILIMTMSA